MALVVAFVAMLKTLAPGVVLSIVSRLLVAPPVPELDLGVGRHVPIIRRSVEAVCQAMYFLGASAGFDLGVVAGIGVTFFALAVLWLFRAFLRALARSFRDAIGANRPSPYPAESSGGMP